MNYVKYSNDIKKLKIYDDLSILDFLVDRISNDREFRKRQRIIGKIATLIKGLGLLNIFKLLPNLVPYMKLKFYWK